jgi:ABC-type siderophore export system fused ATPase/permease subunit
VKLLWLISEQPLRMRLALAYVVLLSGLTTVGIIALVNEGTAATEVPRAALIVAFGLACLIQSCSAALSQKSAALLFDAALAGLRRDIIEKWLLAEHDREPQSSAEAVAACVIGESDSISATVPDLVRCAQALCASAGCMIYVAVACPQVLFFMLAAGVIVFPIWRHLRARTAMQKTADERSEATDFLLIAVVILVLLVVAVFALPQYLGLDLFAQHALITTLLFLLGSLATVMTASRRIGAAECALDRLTAPGVRQSSTDE